MKRPDNGPEAPGSGAARYNDWASFCDAEFGISRAQAYRLLDVARSLAAIRGAIAAGAETSRTRDSDPAAAAALDYGLSRRALIPSPGVRTPSRS
ncbi:hypothetical protein [Streptomyces sp. NPDC003032]